MTVPNSLKTVKAKLKALPKVSLHNSKPTHVWWLKKPLIDTAQMLQSVTYAVNGEMK